MKLVCALLMIIIPIFVIAQKGDWKELNGEWNIVYYEGLDVYGDADNLFIRSGLWSFGSHGSSKSAILYSSYNPCEIKCCVPDPNDSLKFLHYAQLKWGADTVNYRLDKMSTDSLIIMNMKDGRKLVFSKHLEGIKD